MPSQRQFFSDAVSTKLLFYSPAGDSGAAAADPVGAVEAAGSVAAPDEGEGYSYRIFKVSSFAVDGYGAPSVTPTPTSAAAAAAADSVARYLEEFYPTKPEFKARTKAYVAALRGRDATAAAAAGDFAGMQELTRRVLKDFSNWRFYKAIATDSDVASDGGRGGGGNRSGVGGDTGGGGGGDRDVEGMIVMRQDEEDGVTATFYFWAAGLVKARDPRDRQFSAGEVEILRQVGEGHPSEVYEACLYRSICLCTHLFASSSLHLFVYRPNLFAYKHTQGPILIRCNMTHLYGLGSGFYFRHESKLLARLWQLRS